MANRPGMIVRGVEHPIQGEMLEVGTAAPDFELVTNDMDIKRLSDYDGRVKVISCVPSLETRVCSAQTHRFNEEAASLGDDIVVLTVSADLPYAQKRWCGNEGVDRTETLSDHRTMSFAEAYGLHDTDWRILQRAAFVLDRDNVIQYAEYVHVMGDEVNFDAIIEKARTLV